MSNLLRAILGDRLQAIRQMGWTGVNVFNAHCDLRIGETQTNYRYGWGPSRPLGLDTISHRLKCAWKVWRGEYDVLSWSEPSEKPQQNRTPEGRT